MCRPGRGARISQCIWGWINVPHRPIQDLIGRLSIVQIIELMLRGEVPGGGEAILWEPARLPPPITGYGRPRIPQRASPSIAVSFLHTAAHSKVDAREERVIAMRQFT